MSSDLEKLERGTVDAIVEYFKKIPDIMDYTLDCSTYPLVRLENLRKVLSETLVSLPSRSDLHRAYDKINKQLSGLIATRIDYVYGFIEQVLGKESMPGNKYFLETALTSDILFHIDLMKDAVGRPELEERDYNKVLQKLIKVLKLRFNEALNIHKELHFITYEEVAKDQLKFPQEELEHYQKFLDDALLMTQKHITVKTEQIRHLKGTLLKILEALAIRALESKEASSKEQYKQTLNSIETCLTGFEAEFAREVVERFSNMTPEVIVGKYSLTTIKHNRKLIELIIDRPDASELVLDLYDPLVSFTIAESEKARSFRKEKQDVSASMDDVEIIKTEEEPEKEMKQFATLTLTQKALTLIRLSFYGLFETVASLLSLTELNKYPIGILKSTEKTLKELEQQGLSEKDIKLIRNNKDYLRSLERIENILAHYKTSGEKYDFAYIYRETDYEVSGISYCVFNDLILRMIQNIGEASFITDTKEAAIPQDRRQELEVTITERYRTEWNRQLDEQHKEEKLELIRLAENLF
jgi:hypothetical protein